jgi:CRISPR/Cas system-associated exonuclease Cas4 (RecB family)
MQSTFIGKLTQTILADHGHNLSEVCIVFPSRRASVFFKDSLLGAISGTSFCPSLLTIEEFVHQLHPVTVLDNTSLIFELFPIYRDFFPEESFESYFSWAGTLIQDFDEIDRSLVDADKVYQNLFDLREIDATIGGWWVAEGKTSDYQARYLNFWQQMPHLYHRLKTRLKAQGFAMPGQALRDLTEKMETEIPPLPWERVVFAGFNALSKAEESLIGKLLSVGKAKVYWDFDRWEVDNPLQEAGRHFRKLRDSWEQQGICKRADWTWIEDRLTKEPKKIVITGVPKRVGQAKAAGLKLREILAQTSRPEKIAVVLPDENLLFPLLHALPPELKEVNVTMGFPLRHTPLFGLVESLVEMHENAERLQPGRVTPKLYFRDVRVILRHPYVQQLAFEEVRRTLSDMNKDSMNYLPEHYFLETFGEDHFLTFLFGPWSDVPQVIGYFLELFSHVRKCLERPDGSLSAFEGEYLFQFHTLTQKLRDKLEHYSVTLDQRMFRRIYRDLVRQASIPFAGEPLQGVQVMGMLETRALDFEKIVVLSVNEGILPTKPKSNSFIPYSLRKAFGLAVQEDKDAVYAYHFYRLLHCPDVVYLLHNTEQDSMGSGEKSRFISQVLMELAPSNPLLQIKNETLTFPTHKEIAKAIQVVKTEAMLAALRDSMNRVYPDRKSGFSPSALSTYISCSLKFYFRYVLHLREKDDMEHSMAPHTFGKVLHKVMENFYAPFKGRPVTESDVAEMRNRSREAVLEAFVQETKTTQYSQGKNYLLVRVIGDLVNQMLELDAKQTPFEIVDLEHEITGKIVTERNPDGFALRGFIDRMDRKQGVLRIVDYKTGKVELRSLESFADLVESNNHAEAFQLALYAWMCLKSGTSGPTVKAGIYPMRTLSRGFQPLALKKSETEFDEVSMREFEDTLSGLVDEIFDEQIPFIQTEDPKRCEFCAYKNMCVRQ